MTAGLKRDAAGWLHAALAGALVLSTAHEAAAQGRGRRSTNTPSATAATSPTQTSATAASGRLAGAAEAAPSLPANVIANAQALRDEALKGNEALSILETITTEFGPRPAGSDAEHRAALWAAGRMKQLGFDNVRIETFPVTQWERGEDAALVLSPFPQRLVVAALGGSVATRPQGIDAEIALFRTYDEMLAQPPQSLTGRIVVVTEPMGKTGDGSSYGAAYRIRGQGPSEAAKRGAAAYLIRSLASDDRRLPHTGMLAYSKDAPQIPAAALSAPDAEQLERMVARGKPVRLRLVLTPTVRAATSDTVIGEIRGSSQPNQIVLIGGHLDSWDLGTGAIDDGAGVATTMAAATLIHDMPRRPARTIRVALWGAEEIGVSGAAYAAAHPAAEQANHVIASECDLGADHIYSISLPKGAAASSFGRSLGRVVAPLRTFIAPAPARDGGSDLEELRGVPLASLNQDASRYFELHHTADDTFDKVNPTELNQNVAAWAVFTYLAADSGVDFRSLAAPTIAPEVIGPDGPRPRRAPATPEPSCVSTPPPPTTALQGATAAPAPTGQASPRELRTPQLEAFPVLARPPDIVPGRPQRAWMDKFNQRHPYRCLPLTMANTTGWEILLPFGFIAEWNGGKEAADITFLPDRPHPDFEDVVKSHFTGGVITFHPGYLFRTSPGWDMLCAGPPNHVKDGVQPLVGLVETDWLPFPFTMNWIFTRPGRIRFEKGEPFCFITLQPHRVMDAVQPVQRSLASEPRLREQFDLWYKERAEFNKRLAKGDPEAAREAWQRFYFKGEMPDASPVPADDHINKRRLRALKLGR